MTDIERLQAAVMELAYAIETGEHIDMSQVISQIIYGQGNSQSNNNEKTT